MKLKNVLIVVKDIERSRQFYHDLFGLEMILDNDGNMILTEGLVLQEEKYWKEFLGKEIISENNSCEKRKPTDGNVYDKGSIVYLINK